MALLIYTKTGCPYCEAALKSFKASGAEYEEINLSNDPSRIDEMVKISGSRKVPVIVDGDKISVGFNGSG